jgi:hypothetical protein
MSGVLFELNFSNFPAKTRGHPRATHTHRHIQTATTITIHHPPSHFHRMKRMMGWNNSGGDGGDKNNSNNDVMPSSCGNTGGGSGGSNHINANNSMGSTTRGYSVFGLPGPYSFRATRY